MLSKKRTAARLRNEKQLSVGITSWTLTSISKAFYPIDIVNITSVFNDSNNQLYLLVEYGSEKLPAGPDLEDSEEIIVVEGRADVMNMLKHGFSNVIGMNGTNIPKTVIDLSKEDYWFKINPLRYNA